jgi:hypothetical protein
MMLYARLPLYKESTKIACKRNVLQSSSFERTAKAKEKLEFHNRYTSVSISGTQETSGDPRWGVSRAGEGGQLRCINVGLKLTPTAGS